MHSGAHCHSLSAGTHGVGCVLDVRAGDYFISRRIFFVKEERGADAEEGVRAYSPRISFPSRHSDIPIFSLHFFRKSRVARFNPFPLFPARKIPSLFG